MDLGKNKSCESISSICFHTAYVSYSSFQYSLSSVGMVSASMILCLCKQATWKEIHVI